MTDNSRHNPVHSASWRIHLSLGAVLSPLRGANAERETMPVACDAERQVSNARRR